jgi:hypothetical protein
LPSLQVVVGLGYTRDRGKIRPDDNHHDNRLRLGIQKLGR